MLTYYAYIPKSMLSRNILLTYFFIMYLNKKSWFIFLLSHFCFVFNSTGKINWVNLLCSFLSFGWKWGRPLCFFVFFLCIYTLWFFFYVTYNNYCADFIRWRFSIILHVWFILHHLLRSCVDMNICRQWLMI